MSLNDSPWTPSISGHSARLMSVLAFESKVLARDMAISLALIAFPERWASIGDTREFLSAQQPVCWN